MFTGLVEGMGSVIRAERTEAGRRLAVEPPFPVGELSPGESVAVDGACLSVAELDGAAACFDVIHETLRRTTLGGLAPGSRVNLERSVRLSDRLGGHLVQGHVDTVAEVLAVERAGGEVRLRVALPDEIARYVAFKGSVALAGVSLTVAALDDETFEVALIPLTLRETTLGRLAAGDRLNVEVDLVARYLERLS